ncbi:PIN domain-like protein [Melampsora americana]|nr:PIN domain-like protein [Melampsora americana]
MGVQGLWTLITPVARPIKLETMGNKKLAIDSSIWLYQFQNAMRDREGRALTNAHILGFLRRISKLLYYGIKPVFVFDGGAPVLKRQTINERKKRKQGGQENLAKTAEKLLAAQLRQAAVVQAQRRAGIQDSGDQITTNSVYFNDNLARDFAEKNTIPSKGKRRSSLNSPTKESPVKSKYVPKDQYQLPPITRRTPPKEVDHRLATEEELSQFIDQMKPEDLDINSPHFQALSTEMKYEIIGDLRIKSRQQNHARVEAMKLKSDQDFSQVQILNLKQRNELTQKLLTVTDMVGKANLTIPVKIAAQRNKEYVLVKAQDGWVLGMNKAEGDTQKSPVKVDVESDDDEDFVEVTDYVEPYTLRHTSRSQAAEDSDEAEFEEVTIPSTDDRKTLRARDHMTEAIRYHYGSQNAARSQSPEHRRSIHTGAQLFNRDDEEEELQEAIMNSIAEVSAFEPIDRDASSSTAIRNRKHMRTDLEEGSTNDSQNQLLREPFSSDLTRAKKDSPNRDSSFRLPDLNGCASEPKTGTMVVDHRATTSKSVSALAHPPSKPRSFLEPDASTDTSRLQAQSNHMDLAEFISSDRLVNTPSASCGDVEMNAKSTLAPIINNKAASHSLSQGPQGTKARIPTPAPQSLDSNQLSKPDEKDVTHGDTSDEEPIPWSRSPTPVARPQNNAKQAAISVDVASDPEEDDLNVALEAEERELAHNLESESNQWTKFLSELQDAERLDDMRHQADAEVNRLKDQRVKDRRDADDVNLQMSKDIQSMLRLFGIPYVISPMEAEAQCAELLKKGLVDGIITDDSDVFLFGGTRVYKNMFNQNKFVECYLMNDLEKELGLSRQRLIQLAYLLGSDYTEGLAGVGPVTAMEILNEFDDEHLTVAGLDSLINFKKWWMKVQVGKDNEKESGSAFRKKFRKKKDKIWLEDSWPNPAVAEAYHKPTVDTSDQRFTWGFPDLDGIRQFLSDHLSWPSSKTDDVILPLIKRQTQRINGVEHTQGVLDSFFDYSLTNGTTSYAPPPKIVSGFQSQKLQTIVQNWRKKQKEQQDSNQNQTVLDAPVPAAAQSQSTSSRSKSKKKTSTTQSSRKKPKKNTASTSEPTSKQPRKRAVRAKRAIVDQELEARPVEGASKHFVENSEEAPAQPVIRRPVRAKRAQRRKSSDDDEFRIETSSADEWMASLVD